MNPIVHGEIGWLVGVRLERWRDRLLVTAAALLPDLDGAGLLVSEYWYAELHHKLLHGAIALVVVPLLLGAIARSLKVWALSVVAFVSHILADLAGSGPGWPIYFWYPFDDTEWLPSWQWDLASWQNTLIGLAVTLTCLACARWFARTPVELFSRRADARVVETVRARIGSGEDDEADAR